MGTLARRGNGSQKWATLKLRRATERNCPLLFTTTPATRALGKLVLFQCSSSHNSPQLSLPQPTNQPLPTHVGRGDFFPIVGQINQWVQFQLYPCLHLPMCRRERRRRERRRRERRRRERRLEWRRRERRLNIWASSCHVEAVTDAPPLCARVPRGSPLGSLVCLEATPSDVLHPPQPKRLARNFFCPPERRTQEVTYAVMPGMRSHMRDTTSIIPHPRLE